MTDTQKTVTATTTDAPATASNESTAAAPDSQQAAGTETVAENVQGNGHHHGNGNGNGNGGGGRGCCGGHGQGRYNWQDKRRLKMIGAVVLIALVGFMLGRGSAHHRDGHMEGGRHGNPHHQMEFSRGEQAAPSLSTILDGIAASPEQRSKAVELFR